LIKAQQENLRTFSHITGGGLADNTARVIPDGLIAKYDRSTWALPAEMEFMATIAGVPQQILSAPGTPASVWSPSSTHQSPI
jgi:phosphoribosylformylglycinamidine cyclo-ligase